MSSLLPPARDGFQVDPAAVTAEAHAALSEWIAALPPEEGYWWKVNIKEMPQFKSLQKIPPEKQVLFVVAAIERKAWSDQASDENYEAHRAQKPSPHPKAAHYTEHLL